MQIVHARCCGLDIHKKLIVACLITPGRRGSRHKEVRRFGAMTADLIALGQWLRAAGCTHVAMESTGIFWKPVFNVLEDVCEIVVANAQHIKGLPGRKTDSGDAEWIADLLQHGLLRASFIPSRAQREVRDLTRHRATLIAERARIVNRLQKVLEDANIKLAGVASDIMGASARDMLAALIGGETDASRLADFARGRMRAKRDQLEQALSGRVRPHHCYLLTEHLGHIDFLDEAIERLSREIALRLGAMQEDMEVLIDLLDTIPGVSRRVAEVLIAEIGADLSRFPSAHHLASWAGLCPGNHESAGKRKTGRTRKGSRWLRQTLIEAAHAAARSKKTYIGAQYRRLAARRGTKKAEVALAHTILIIAYHVLTRKEPYRDLGPNYFDEHDRQAVERRLVRRLEKLGLKVSIAPAA
jgi:transposase